jgi:hypothetical protein
MKSPLALHPPLRNSHLTKLSFRNIVIFFHGHIQIFPDSILLSLNIALTHGQMSPQSTKSSAHFTHPKLWISKPKSTSYMLLGSFTPFCIPSGFPTPSPLTKNRALFASAPIFVISTMCVPKKTFQPPSFTKLSMTVPSMRPCPSWMGSLATIKSKST